MKKIIGIIGVGAIAVLAISSTCSSNAEAQTVEPQKSMVEETEVRQEQVGIQFSHFSFEEAKAEAKKTNKLIFIDAYTSWCGPCKVMAATSFKDPKVGSYFNSNFINLKIDMEKGEGPELARLFKVRAYPTLIIVNGDGRVVKQSIGMKNGGELLAFGKSAGH